MIYYIILYYIILYYIIYIYKFVISMINALNPMECYYTNDHYVS